MYLVVGLGNPEEKYNKTFHNVGFLAVSDLAIKLGVNFTKKECKGLTASLMVNGQKVILAKPLTYMNLSGQCVKALMDFYKIPVENVIVLYDDYDLSLGSVRIRKNGSSGSHNGMRSIVAEVGSTEFKRIRIGINANENNIPLVDYVLSQIRKEDYQTVISALNCSVDAVFDLLNGKTMDYVMQKYNVVK